MIWIYLAGLLTPVAVCAILFALCWSFSASQYDHHTCDHCVSAGLRTMKKRSRFRISEWLESKVHQYFTARLPKHRRAWQKWYDELESPLAQTYSKWRYAEAQQRYGWDKA